LFLFLQKKKGEITKQSTKQKTAIGIEGFFAKNRLMHMAE
jgi:hypothetical protein